MATAEFLGFKPEYGLTFYKSTTLLSGIYGVWGLARKAGAWRLFRWLPQDYYRKVNTMGKPALTMKIVGYGVQAKVIVDSISMAQDQYQD